MQRYMKNLTLGLIIVIMLAEAAQAQSSVWVIKGAKSNIYLAGSCHVLRSSDYPLPAEFETAYIQSPHIIFEAPPGDLNTMEYLEKLMAIAVYNDGTTIKEHLTQDVYSKVEKFCNLRNHPFKQYQSFRPWMLSMTLVMREMERLGVKEDSGVDHFFYHKAIKDGKGTGGLETADEQLVFFKLIDGSMGNEQVSETVDYLLHLDSKVQDILNTWRKGDEAGIEAFSLREIKNYPQLYSTLIVDRNRKWAKKIENLTHGNRSVMVIVGVAHLVGKDSVVDLLRKGGYQVTKLRNER